MNPGHSVEWCLGWEQGLWGEEAEQAVDDLGGFMGIGMGQDFRSQIFLEQTFKVNTRSVSVCFGRGLLRQLGQGTCIQPESGAFGTLVDFVAEGFAEAMPVQQGMNAMRAGVLNVTEHMDAFRTFHVGAMPFLLRRCGLSLF